MAATFLPFPDLKDLFVAGGQPHYAKRQKARGRFLIRENRPRVGKEASVVLKGEPLIGRGI